MPDGCAVTRQQDTVELGAEVYAACSQLFQTASDIHATARHYSGVPRGTVSLTVTTVVGATWLCCPRCAAKRRTGSIQVLPQRSLTDNDAPGIADAVYAP